MEASPGYLASLLPGGEAESPPGELARRIYEAKKIEFHSLGLVLGHRYTDSPIVEAADAGPTVPQVTTYEPTSTPGARLPHGWLADGVSLYDRLGPALTLLRLDPGIDVGPLTAAAADLGIPLAELDVDPTRLPHDYAVPLYLVRPDPHVAWRGTTVPAQPRALLARVTGR